MPRVAIVAAGDDKDASSLADLLTAAMSQDAQGYELVERAELNRIAQEAEVQAMTPAERPRALARLAKADGLLLIATEPSGNARRSVSARLSSTSSGLILQTFLLAAEPKELPTAAKLAADALRFAAARTGKERSGATHIISLLGIRANTSSSPGVAMEATLNTAITHHLSNTGGFGVVERWKLDDVAFERSLSEKDMPTLATGTALVDGSLDVIAKLATVKLRIRNSQADPGKLVSVEGPADDVPALARTIAAKVTAESGATIAPKSWDTKAEGDAYAKLGHWLLAQRMFREAAQAYETAVALGDVAPETLFNRIYSYCSISDPKNPKTGTTGGQIDYSAFSRRSRQLVEYPDFFPAALRNASRAMASAEELLSREWRPPPGTMNVHDYSFAMRNAGMGCQLLVAAYRLKMHLKAPVEVAALRQRTEFFARFYLATKRRHITEFTLPFYAGYWAATPEDAVAVWRESLKPVSDYFGPSGFFLRKVLNNEFSGSGYLDLFSRIPAWPLIVDWSGTDNERADAAWQGLLKALKESPSLATKADGLVLDIYTQKDPKESERLLTSYLNLLDKNIALLADSGEQWALSFYDPTVRKLPGSPEGAAAFASVFERLLALSPKVNLEIWDPILKQVQTYLTPDFRKVRLLQKDEAMRLQAALEKYMDRIRASGEAIDRTKWDHSVILNMVAAIKFAYPSDVASSPAKEPSNTPPADPVALRLVAVANEMNPKDTRFWASSPQAFEDHLLIRRGSYGFSGVVLGPDMSKREMAPVPKEPLRETSERYGTNLMAFGPDLNPMSTFGTYYHFSPAENRWTDRTSLLGGFKFAMVKMVGDVSYAATADSGFTLGRLNAGRFELIASSRRLPVEHPLDALAGARIQGIFPGAKGRPCAVFKLSNHAEIYDIQSGKKIFSMGIVWNLTVSGRTPILEDLCLVAAIDPDSGIAKALLRIPYPRGYNADILKDDLPPEAVWDWPKDIPVNFSQGVNFISRGFAVRGDHLFVLKCQHSVDSLVLNQGQEPSSDKLSLLCYEPGRRGAIEIPLTFDAAVLKPYGVGEKLPASALEHPEYDASRVHTTSAGIFFALSPRWPGGRKVAGPKPGVLHLPWSDVNAWLTLHGHRPIRLDVPPGALPPTR